MSSDALTVLSATGTTLPVDIAGFAGAGMSEKLYSFSSAVKRLERLEAMLEQERETNTMLMRELEKAQYDAEKMENAICHRDAVIAELAETRRKMGIEFREMQSNLQAEVRQLQQISQDLKMQLVLERKKSKESARKLKDVCSRSSMVNEECDGTSMDTHVHTPNLGLDDLFAKHSPACEAIQNTDWNRNLYDVANDTKRTTIRNNRVLVDQ